MRFIADLHIHSKYSRATSREMSPESIWKWAQLKGITVIGTGDFTHPKWFQELNEKIAPAGSGLFKLKKEFQKDDIPDSCKGDVSFLLSAEISCIYSKNGKTRKIHSIIFAPDFKDAARINASLAKIGNLAADGRPILGLDAKELLKIVLDASPDAMLVPAHAWTPHFSVFGSASGFDTLEECFEELTPHIHAIETGLSSDPAMNWRLSALDRITLISNSDAHSPKKIGREANIFDTEISYKAITGAIKTKKGFSGTIEFFPEEGKYHYDGHRFCKASLTPQETLKHNYLCPVCSKKVTVGVMHRVEKLADREDGFKPRNALPYYSIIPLPEIISEVLKVGVNSKKVDSEYQALLQKLGSEFKILKDTPLEEIEKASSPLLREAISRMRKGNVHIAPGYDGEYGKIKIFEKVEREAIKGQMMLL
ncbi:MAG: DNA helicase UvrD [Deltaproteobacteria bacterium GWC2_42_51]|nr:MAG: DNA helicase UvrD [Deltaproteobacteria bacterium GWA2_42_85]OGP31147.1 MAG: DNA helicase UvrD [Deltaproteobacteria bacterium GWC2_42_51]OGP44742.1 MAG: DNA helicase UvrD [Deltaproteobacteria bacterium GWD2_42_10]OGP47364.1 MAG: DNA helicase UvrD [Deltaproteobacteria bacterium GWF2_42_12]OGQ30180.1 MAG: DNA helicase UvrD [Deltaproteobacteria bacterium RIFCSPHIGHO2_02_FULL_42_44]OGQ35525.1 MAG: DNA helicase UvrD [Deltaproteobacteria bacterium RIFCSPLOWO2_02_FULL_42_39]OGQ65610.1 MAG: DN